MLVQMTVTGIRYCIKTLGLNKMRGHAGQMRDRTVPQNAEAFGVEIQKFDEVQHSFFW